MPITRRKTLPPVVTSQPYEPGPSIESLIKKHDNLASDFAWEGDYAKAEHHQTLAEKYRDKLAAGELYEPSF